MKKVSCSYVSSFTMLLENFPYSYPEYTIFQVIRLTIALPESGPDQIELDSAQSQQLKINNPQSKPFGYETKRQQFSRISAPPEYPQLTSYTKDQHPKSIQDIIKYLNVPRAAQNSEKVEVRAASNGGGVWGNSTGFKNEDPLRVYKPDDVGEINMMATANFRFAPPVWRSTYRSGAASNHRYVDFNEPNIGYNGHANSKRPIVINMNIYSMDGRSTNLLKSMFIDLSKPPIS